MADRVTLGDVAAAAGVSIATASRSLHGSGGRRVNDELHRRVVAAAEALHYEADTNAQAVARGRTSVVGLIVHDIADPYFSSIAAGLTERAEAAGLMVTLATTHRDPHRELEYVRVLRSQRVRSLVLVGSRFDDRALIDQLATEVARYEGAGGRVAAISQARVPVDTIVLGNRSGARALADALHDRGHRRFAILAGPSKLLTSSDRVAGFRDALARRGSAVPRERIFRSAFTRDGGYEAMVRALDAGVDVTCVFAVNDVMAVGAMAALRDRGIELPGGMSVAGFDDIETLRDITPSLTTVRLPLEQLGARALELTLSDPPEHPRTVRVDGDIVLRESTPGVTATAVRAGGQRARP